MEKRLRSSLQSSGDEFISSAIKVSLKSSKANLKSLIHSIPPSSPLSSSLPSSLHRALLRLLTSAASPPPKRLRRSTRLQNDQNTLNTNKNEETLDKLRVLAHVAFLCISHPKKTFSPPDLLPSVQILHDKLIFFESDVNLCSEIAGLCEEYWKLGFEGRDLMISQLLPYLVSKSLTLKKKVDVHRVYSLREAFSLFDFDDDSIEDLKLLLIRCWVSPVYLKSEEGRKFLGFMCGLSRQLLKEVLAMVKSQIGFGRKSMLEAYGEVLFRAWKGVEGDFKEEIENGFLQDLIDSAIHASSLEFAACIRRVLGGFVSQKIVDGVEKLLFWLAEPVIFRSLQVANSNVRLNALHLLLDLFPLEDPDAEKEVNDTLHDRQLFLLEKLLMDDCPDVRVVAVEGCCRVLHLFWEIIPASTITKILKRIFDDMAHDICSEVKLSTLNGIVYLLGNPLSHEVLKVMLPRLGHLILDKVLSVRVAVVDLLLLLRDISSFQFYKVVSLDVLLCSLVNDQPQVAQKITNLLITSYFSSKRSTEDACNRCVTLFKRSPKGGARFCEFIVLEGAPLKSVMELVKVLIDLVLSSDEKDVDQIEGFLSATAHICSNLVSEQPFKNALNELFSGGKVKRLFSAASSQHSRSSLLNILATISPDDVTGLIEGCLILVTRKCNGLSDNVDLQDEVQAAHRLLLSCDCFDEMFEVLTGLLQKTAYRCHVKFGTELPNQIISPRKRKKAKSSVKLSAKWKHVSRKIAAEFGDDYNISAGVAWQIRDLLLSEEARKALLTSQDLELSFLALKVITEVSIEQCISCEYMETTPVLAYTALAFHMTLQNIALSDKKDSASKKSDRSDSSTMVSETLLDQTADHLLNSAEKLVGSCRKHSTDSSNSSDNEKLCDKEKTMSNMMKMLTAILKFIVDSLALGYLSQFHTRCINFTSAYLKHISVALRQQSYEQFQFKVDELKEIDPCLKSSFTYAAKLLSLILRDVSEASSPSLEAHFLANNMFDLIASIDLYLGSRIAGRLVAAAKPWLPDLILALGFVGILHQKQVESTYSTVLNQMKSNFPSWLSFLAKQERSEINEVNLEEEDRGGSDSVELVVFKRFMDMIVTLLKGNHKIVDAVGVILLTAVVIGLERKDFRLVLGLLLFVCVKLVGAEDRQWSGLDMMLASLPEIYPQIEKEIQENDEEDVRQKLQSVKKLLEPVWLYHVYETERFSMMED